MTVEEWLGKDNTLGIDIFKNKYQFEGETFDHWLDRVSGGDDEVRQLIEEKKFLFGGRILANRGTGKRASMSNCYSRGFVEDSLDDLMQAATDIAHTFKAQGGQGISLSKVRPKGCGINSNQFTSDGIIPFMEIYNRVTESISQGGSRKGALLMSLDIWHKEAEDFIKIKSEEGRIQKANLSVEIDDDFMKCVQIYYDTGEIITKTITRKYGDNNITYEVTPIKLYKLMMQKAWDWAEPGCIFTNRFRNYNLMEFVDDYQIETCNPCGEQPLVKHGACNLGSINLSEFVNNPFTTKASFDFEALENATRICIRALDDIIDENADNHALQKQKEMALKYRNCGLGIMGLYDAFAKLGLKYGSKKSIDYANEIMKVMLIAAIQESNILAKEKGAFPGWDSKVLNSELFQKVTNHFDYEELSKYGLRNCSLLSIAPSGSIATMLNVSTGCEPLFAKSYQRKTESLNNGEDKYYTVYAGIIQDYFDTTGSNIIPDYFIESHEVDWHDRVDLQGALQEYVDTAISSTINLRNEVAVEEIEQLYLYAWKKGLKGITIFRDGCARLGILTTGTIDTNKQEDVSSELKRGMIIKADDNCIGKKRTLQTGCGTLHCEAFFDPDTGDLLETYLSKGSTGGCNNFMVGLSRMISLSARGGVDINSIVDQLKSSGTCPSYAVRTATRHDTSKGSCCPVAIGNALVDMHNEMMSELVDDYEEDKTTSKNVKMSPTAKCPQCGGNLVFEGGCNTCKDCGWSKCD